ncbi:hypothetical protein [Pseudonocardia lacus]|uniref:hypothetical protein n=1 Tax=Pseudonocardia lacus TaxID=2835865 RepID=UPI001BDC72B8|nr:hypothetical protein [Pseudonocardia lacus]
MADDDLPRLLSDLGATAVGTLLAQHVDDGRGYCRACSLPQAGPSRWPCTLRAAAVAARDLARRAR